MSHHTTYWRMRPCVRRQVLGVGDAYDAKQSPTFDYRESSVSLPHGVLEHEVVHVNPGGATAGVGSIIVLTVTPSSAARTLCCWREPSAPLFRNHPMKAVHRPAEDVATQQARYAPRDEHKRERLAHI